MGRSLVKEKIIVHFYGKKVDVTGWSAQHPGGEKVLRIFNGRDATEQFEAMHSKEAHKRLEKFLKYSPPVEPSDIKVSAPTYLDVKANAKMQAAKDDLVILRKEVEKLGLFRPNIFFEIAKIIYVHVCVLGGGYLMGATDYTLLGAILLTAGWHQSGWVAHDYAHHSVFASPAANDIMAAWLGGLQGYTVSWWKARHCTHHVTTNEVGNDPDIRTAPVFRFVQQYRDLKARLRTPLSKLQSFYFLPMMAVLDLYWRFESIQYVALRIRKYAAQAALLVLHYAFLVWIAFNCGWMPLVIASFVRGFGTAVVVFSSHYAEERMPKEHELSFLEQTTRTSRNIEGSSFLHFMTGYISYQVEHHLIPTLPRSNLPKISPMVKALCRKHNLPYNQSSLVACVMRNIKSLSPNFSLDDLE
eukprot:Opistho-2@95488